MARWQDSQCGVSAANRFWKLLPRLLILMAIGSFEIRSLYAQDKAARIYFFSMEGCPPCAQMEPGIDDLIQKGYPITKVDARRQPKWVAQFKITNTPTTVFVEGNREVARHSGVLAMSALSNWLDNARSAGSRSNLVSSNARSVVESDTPSKRQVVPNDLANNATVGTRTPQTEGELAAMRSTVRIRVEDNESFSFGSGTVIHSHEGACLVLTCGHLFRDSQGKGSVTADVNWADEKQVTVPGEVISYDADANDVALVVIRPGFHIPAVSLASPTESIAVGESAFSIGCDKGQPPTIRATKIKNHSYYDGSHKYDIFGRPSIGRSGGGLFRKDGSLVGVCNAAAVNEDEGIFTSLDNIHAELGRAKLAHLFQQPDARVIAAAEVNPTRKQGVRPENLRKQNEPLKNPIPAPSPELLALAAEVKAQRQDQVAAANDIPQSLSPIPTVRNASLEANGDPAGQLNPANRGTNDTEVIVLVRSKADPRNTETIVLDDLPPGFVDDLRSRSRTTQPQEMRDLAELRNSMPELRESKGQRNPSLRAQSPR